MAQPIKIESCTIAQILQNLHRRRVPGWCQDDRMIILGPSWCSPSKTIFAVLVQSCSCRFLSFGPSWYHFDIVNNLIFASYTNNHPAVNVESVGNLGAILVFSSYADSVNFVPSPAALFLFFWPKNVFGDFRPFLDNIGFF